jgi:hypothetical protein
MHNKVYKFEEYIKLRRKNKVPILDEYNVQFYRTRADPVETVTYVADGKDQHEAVQAQWAIDFPGCTFYRVSYG